jgi:hypothetical protein
MLQKKQQFSLFQQPLTRNNVDGPQPDCFVLLTEVCLGLGAIAYTPVDCPALKLASKCGNIYIVPNSLS